MSRVEELLKQLPPELQQEVEDFAEFLVLRGGPAKGRKLTQSWAGALKAFRDKYTSLEPQKKAIEWRED